MMHMLMYLPSGINRPILLSSLGPDPDPLSIS